MYLLYFFCGKSPLIFTYSFTVVCGKSMKLQESTKSKILYGAAEENACDKAILSFSEYIKMSFVLIIEFVGFFCTNYNT